MTPKISFIISAFDRPKELHILLLSLICQTEPNWEAIITDNAMDEGTRYAHRCLCNIDNRISYVWTGQFNRHCYYTAELGWKLALGEWLSFPCDDTYYVRTFAEKMLLAGETGTGCDIPAGERIPAPLDIVCCDFVWGRHNSWTYCDGGPQVCHVNKASFIIRTSEMMPFPDKDKLPNPPCEGLLVEAVVAKGKRVGRVVECLVVHN